MPSRSSRRLALTLLAALAANCALRDLASAEEAPKPAAAESPFYGEGNGFLSIVEPILVGEEGFVSRAKSLAAGEEPFGLVLSGGSARAFAHIGVLEVLEEEGLRPDFVVADSMGAIVALLYCAGMAPEDIGELFASYPAAALFDPEIPLSGGFLDAGRFEGLVRALVGDLDLSELPIPAMVACEDLRSRRQVLIAEGGFAEVMAAAFALPAVFEPVSFRGMLLVDGGVTDLAPVEIAYRYSGRVAAVTAFYDKELSYSSPFVVINRTIDIGKTRRSIEEMLELRPLVVRCDVEDLSYMQFSRPAEVAERGRVSAEAALPALRELSSARPPSAALAERRAWYHERVTRLSAAARLGASLGAAPGALAGASARLLDEASGGPAAFAGRRWIGPEAELRGGPATLALCAAAGLEGREERAWAALARAAIDGYAFPRRGVSGAAYDVEARALLSGSGLLDGGSTGSAIAPPEPRELAAALAASLAFAPAPFLVLRPEAKAELGLELAGGAAEWRGSAGLGLEARPGPGFAAGLGLGAAADYEGNRGPEASASLAWEIGGLAALRLRGAFHAALAGPGLVASPSDPYRGLALEGRAGTRSVSSAEAAWLARPLELDFGELVIIDKPELGGYAECSTADGRCRLTLGATASLGLSVLGLAPLTMSAFAGAGTDGSGWSLGLRAGRFFR